MMRSLGRFCWKGLAPVAMALLILAPASGQEGLDRPPTEEEIDYAPGDGASSSVNPPPFVWLPVEEADNYVLQFSRTATFEPGKTETVKDLPLTVYVPRATLEPGLWYWRYGYSRADETKMGRTRSFSIREDAVALPFPSMDEVMGRIPKARPRVFFDPETIAEMRTEPEGQWQPFIEPVVRAAEAVLARNEDLFPEPRPWEEYEDLRPEYQRIFVAMRPFTQGMVDCALAFLFTGDRRFGEEARRRLLHFMTWDVDGPSSVIWPSELGMDIAERAPRTFDWIYEILTEEERALCREVLARRMAQINALHRSLPFESRPFSSHPGRMIGFVVEGSIVLAHDVPEAEEWLEYTLQLLWSVFPAWGGEDGGWHEGIGYWSGYIRRILNVLVELDRRGIPLKEKPFFRNTGWFGFYVGYPNRQHRAFGDGFEGRITRGMGDTLYIMASLYQNPYFRWYAEQLGGRPTGPTSVAVYAPDLEARSPEELPPSRFFSDVGLVAMHSDLARPDDNILFLMQSSTFGSISHNHANQNAFVLEAFGEPLAISSGYYHAYGRGHHREWVWQTKAHNSVLVNGEGQTPRSRAARGEFLAYEEAGNWTYAAADATRAYDGRLKKFVRHALFVRSGGYVVLIDELESNGEPAAFQWLLHAKNEMLLHSEENRVKIEHGRAGLEVRFLQPEQLTFAQTTGWDPLPERPDDGPPQFHFSATTEPVEAIRIVTVMFPHRKEKADTIPAATLVPAEGGIALRIGDDLVLWKDPRAAEVVAAGRRTGEAVAVFQSD